MASNRNIGAWLAAGILGALLAVACNDLVGSCKAACDHLASCLDGGVDLVACKANCEADGGNDGCANAGAAYDCVTAASCADLQSDIQAVGVRCQAKEQCPDAG
jgi:hypothetical protein